MRRPGVRCQHTHPEENHPGTNVVGYGGRRPVIDQSSAPTQPGHRSHAAAGRLAPFGMRIKVPVLVLDPGKILIFLKSVSLAKIQHQKMKIVFEKHDEETAVKVVYGLLSAMMTPFTNERMVPGWQVVEPGDANEINKLATVDARALLDDYLSATAKGPTEAAAYLERQDKIRKSNLDAITQIYANVKSLNAEQRNVAIRVTQVLNRTQLWMSLVVKGLSLVPGGGKAAAAVDAAYFIAISQIEHFEDSKGAKVIAFLKTAGHSAGQIVGEKAEHYAEKEILEGEELAKELARLAKRVKKLSQELIRHNTSGVRRQLRKAFALQEELGMKGLSASRHMGALKVAGRAVTVVFAAHEAYEAFHEANIAFDELDDEVEYDIEKLK
jgi:hypothetical protein